MAAIVVPVWHLIHVWLMEQGGLGSRIFAGLSLPPKGQAWDCIGLVESAGVHRLNDALGPCRPHSWYYITWETLDC